MRSKLDRYELSQSEREDISNMFEHICYQQTAINQSANALAAMNRASQTLAQGKSRRFAQWFIERGPAAPILIESLPEVFDTKAMLLMLAYLLGVPVCHASEGPLVVNMQPDRRVQKSTRAFNGSGVFEIHQEYPYLSQTVDYLIILTRYNEDNARTCVSSFLDAKNRLKKSDMDELRKDQYQIHIPSHFRTPLTHTTKRRILVDQPSGYPEFRVRFDRLRCNYASGRRAAKNLSDVLESGKIPVTLPRLSLFVIPNKKWGHGREAFEASFTPRGRVAEKCYVSVDPVVFGHNYDSESHRIIGF